MLHNQLCIKASTENKNNIVFSPSLSFNHTIEMAAKRTELISSTIQSNWAVWMHPACLTYIYA